MSKRNCKHLTIVSTCLKMHFRRDPKISKFSRGACPQTPLAMPGAAHPAGLLLAAKLAPQNKNLVYGPDKCAKHTNANIISAHSAPHAPIDRAARHIVRTYNKTSCFRCAVPDEKEVSNYVPR